MNLLNKFLHKIWPEPKSRVSLIEGKATEITNDLLISGFSALEIAIITKTVESDIKSALQKRKDLLTNELRETITAINKL